MRDLSQKIDIIWQKLKTADAILLGAGAGLSASAGLDYAGEEFREKFADYISKYGYGDLYSMGFHNFPYIQDYWTYWARHVDFTRFSREAFPLYKNLLKLLAGLNYFIITTNVDHQFYKAGFPADRIFAVQGDYGEMQCSRACHTRVYANEQAVRDILEHRQGMTVDPAFVPHCPQCGASMTMHLRVDDRFIEDSNWHKMADRYEAFLDKFSTGRLLLMELGVGFNTPGIIRMPFEEITFYNPFATLIRINTQDARLPDRIARRTVSAVWDIGQVIEMLLEKKE